MHDFFRNFSRNLVSLKKDAMHYWVNVSFLLVLTSGVTMGPQGPTLREGQTERGPKGARFQAIYREMEIGGPFLRSSRGPEIWSYATGVDFVFVFQEDTFYPSPVVKKIQISSQNDLICIRSRRLGSWNKVVITPPINEMMLIEFIIQLCFTRSVKY